MAKNYLGVKMSPEMRKELETIAKSKEITISELVRNICTEYITSQKTEAQLITEMHNEIIQIEGMLSLMHGFNKQIYATILGRTAKEIKSEEEKEIAKRNKTAAKAAIETMLSNAATQIMDGENVWGNIKK